MRHIVEALIQTMTEGDAVDRCYSAQALGDLADKSDATTLHAFLQDDDIDVAIDIVEALGKLSNPESVTLLLEAITLNPDPEMRFAAMEALAVFHVAEPNADIENILIELVNNRPEDFDNGGADWDGYWDLQLLAVKCLGKVGSLKAVPALVAALEDEDGQDIEFELLAAIAKCGPQGIAALNQLLLKSLAKRKRRIAIALKQSKSTLAVDLLLILASDVDSDIQKAALSSLATLSEKTQLSATSQTKLVELLHSLPDQPLSELLRMWIKQNNTSALCSGQWIELLDRKSSEIRRRVFTALSLIDDKQQWSELDQEAIKKHMISALESTDIDEFEASAALAMALPESFFSEEFYVHYISTLTPLIGKDKDELRIALAAIKVLAAIGQGDESTLDQLSFQCLNGDEAKQLAALTALNTLAKRFRGNEQSSLAAIGETAYEVIIQFLTGQHEQALEFAKNIHIEERVPVNVQHLNIPDAQVQSRADILATDAAPMKYSAQSDSLEQPETLEQAEASEQPDTLEQYSSDYSDLEMPEDNGTQSTLASITQANAMSVLNAVPLSKDSDPAKTEIMERMEELPDSLQGFGDVVRNHLNTADRSMKSKRKISGQQRLRYLSARVLAEKPNRDASAALILALSDEDERLREESAKSIGQLAQQVHSGQGLANAVGGLIMQLKVGTVAIQLAAVDALKQLHHRAAVAPIADLLAEVLADKEELDDESTKESRKATDLSVVAHSIEALGNLMNTKLVGSKNPDHMVVHEIEKTEVIELIQAFLNHKDDEIRKAAITALFNMGITSDLPRILNAAVDNFGTLSKWSANILKSNTDIHEQSNDWLVDKIKTTSTGNGDRRVYIEMIRALNNSTVTV